MGRLKAVMYDEDGRCVDEDADSDWEDVAVQGDVGDLYSVAPSLAPREEYSPYITINS